MALLTRCFPTSKGYRPAQLTVALDLDHLGDPGDSRLVDATAPRGGAGRRPRHGPRPPHGAGPCGLALPRQSGLQATCKRLHAFTKAWTEIALRTRPPGRRRGAASRLVALRRPGCGRCRWDSPAQFYFHFLRHFSARWDGAQGAGWGGVAEGGAYVWMLPLEHPWYARRRCPPHRLARCPGVPWRRSAESFSPLLSHTVCAPRPSRSPEHATVRGTRRVGSAPRHDTTTGRPKAARPGRKQEQPAGRSHAGAAEGDSRFETT